MSREIWQRFLDFLCVFFLKGGLVRYPCFIYGSWYTSDEYCFKRFKDALEWEKTHNNIHYKGWVLNEESHRFEIYEEEYNAP